MRVLLVDDEREIRRMMARFLSDIGYDVTPCENGEIALKEYQRDSHPLIISDIMMPHINGYDLCRQIRTLSGGDTPVILMITAYDSPDILQKVLDAGADDYLNKPLRIDLLKIRLKIAEQQVKNRQKQKKTEVALRESEKKYRHLFERSLNGIYRTTPTGQVLMANLTLVKMLGYDTLEELFQIDVAKKGYQNKETRQKFMDLMAKDGEVIGFEAEWRKKNGDILIIRENAQAIYDENGDILYYEGMVEDVTQQKQAERRLAEEKERLAVTLKSIGDGVITTDMGGKIVLLNKAAEEMTGWTQEEAKNKNLIEVFQIINENTKETTANPVERILSNQFIMDSSNYTTLISRNGKKRSIADRGAPIRDKNGDVIGVVLVFRDVTEARRLEQARSRFLNAISHELRTPLTPIIGFTRLLQEMDDLPEKTYLPLEGIMESAKREIKLVEELLTIASLESGTKIYNFIQINAHEFFNEMAIKHQRYLTQTIEERYKIGEYTYQYQLEPELKNALIRIDPITIEDVIKNLLSNAVKYSSPDQLQIMFSVMIEKGHIKVVIEDHGYGISEDEQSKIFEPFYQIRKNDFDVSDGVGQGLAVAKRYIEAHGGQIFVNSQLDKGSQFYFIIPVIK